MYLRQTKISSDSPANYYTQQCTYMYALQLQWADCDRRNDHYCIMGNIGKVFNPPMGQSYWSEQYNLGAVIIMYT